MNRLTTERAEHLKRHGIEYIAAVVKSVYYTEYYNINRIDDILENGGRWIPAIRGQWPAKAAGAYWHGPLGVRGSEIDWTSTLWTGTAFAGTDDQIERAKRRTR